MADEQIDVKIVADAANVKPTVDEARSALAGLVSELTGVASGFVEGASPMALFAEHGIKVTEAIAGMMKGGAGVVAFLEGPWGIAISAGIGLLSALWSKHSEAKEAEDRHKEAADGLSDAIKRLNNASVANDSQTSISIQKDIDAAKFTRDHEVAVRSLIAASLELSRTKLAEAVAAANDPINPDGVFGALMKGTIAEKNIASLTDLILDNAKKTQEANDAIRSGEAEIALQNAEAATNKAAGATIKFKNALTELNAEFRKPGSTMTKEAYEKQAEQLMRARDAALKQGGASAPEPRQTKSRTADWEAELSRQKVALEAKADVENKSAEISKQTEADYWHEILKRNDLSNAEYLAVETKYLALRKGIIKEDYDAKVVALGKELEAAQKNEAQKLDIATKFADQMKATYGAQSKEYKDAQDRITQIDKAATEQRHQIETQTASAGRQRALGNITEDENAAKFRVSMGIETNDQLLTEQERFEDRRHDIQVASIGADIADEEKGTKDPVRLNALNNQLLAAEQLYQQKKSDLTRQHELERTQLQRQAIASTASLWADNIAKLATMQQGFSATLGNLYRGMVGIVSSSLSQMLQKWISAELSKTASALFGITTRTTAEEGASAKSLVLSAATAIKQIAHSAAVAAGHVWAAVSSLGPYGWIIAPALAAAAAFGVIKLGQSLFSAEGGMGAVPYDNAPFLLHKNEMVLPANLASPLRAMLQGGGAANSNAPFAANDGGVGGDFHYHDHSGAMIARAILPGRQSPSDDHKPQARGGA